MTDGPAGGAVVTLATAVEPADPDSAAELTAMIEKRSGSRSSRCAAGSSTASLGTQPDPSLI